MSFNSDNNKKAKILVVDDEESNLRTLRRILRSQYSVLTANSGTEGIEILRQNKDVALILSDQRMPYMTGSQFLGEAIKLSPNSIRFLITGYSDLDAVVDAINTGHIYRYITKPWNPDELLIDVKRAVEHFVATKENQRLSKFNEKLVDDLKELLINTVSAISNALEAKDSYTYGHSHRVTFYSVEIGRILGLDEQSLSYIEFAGLLHDIGKIGVPELILNKPGRLTDEEYGIISKHPLRGGRILSRLKNIQEVISSVIHHHERFDGTGHPDGLKGDQIPLGARILAVADSYDAMTSDRPYRKGMTHQIAVDELNRCAGTQFDPDIVAAFLQTRTGQTGYIPPLSEEPITNAYVAKTAMHKLTSTTKVNVD
jgi:putative nucleotidyltransferase with HDIG domain